MSLHKVTQRALKMSSNVVSDLTVMMAVITGMWLGLSITIAVSYCVRWYMNGMATSIYQAFNLDDDKEDEGEEDEEENEENENVEGGEENLEVEEETEGPYKTVEDSRFESGSEESGAVETTMCCDPKAFEPDHENSNEEENNEEEVDKEEEEEEEDDDVKDPDYVPEDE